MAQFFYHPGDYSDVEREGVRWLGEERGWQTVAVSRKSPQHYNLMVNGEWFPTACLRMWRASYAELEYIDKLDLQNEAVVWREFDRVLATARVRPLISRNLESAVWATWEAISPDAGRCRNMEAIELCLDADRLSMSGHKTADRELDWLDKRFGFDKVQKAIAKRVQLV